MSEEWSKILELYDLLDRDFEAFTDTLKKIKLRYPKLIGFALEMAASDIQLEIK